MKYSLEDILARLPGDHKPNGKGGYITTCPVCGKSEHFYISPGNDGKVLMYCQKCKAPFPEIMKAIGLDSGNTSPAARPPEPVTCKQHQGQKKDHGRQIEKIEYPYRNPDGTIAYWKVRRKFEDGHKVFAFKYLDHGKEVWKKPAQCNNLYHLDKLEQAAPDTPLYIVEGEKCVEAMAARGFLATTTNTGAKKELKLSATDRKYLDKFQSKIMIPDNDEPGREYAGAWKQEGARVLDLSTIWPEIQNKQDVADYFAAGGDSGKIQNYRFRELSAEYIKGLESADLLDPAFFAMIQAVKDPIQRQQFESLAGLRARDLHCKREFERDYKAYRWNTTTEQKQDERATDFPEQPAALRCGAWTCDSDGVRKKKFLENGGVKSEWASPIPVMPTVIYENQEDGTEKIGLSYYKGGRWRSFIVPRSDVANKNKIVGLSDKGLEVTTETAKTLVNYIADMVNLNRDTLPHKDSISHFGWTKGGEFVPYTDKLELDSGEQYGPLIAAIRPRGTLEQWLEIARPLLENPCVRMTIAASLASVLIGPLHVLPFVFHLWGGSGVGKTVGLMVAASVWGDPGNSNFVGSLNSTTNYLMAKMATLHSIPVFGDELQTIKEIGGNYDRLIYTVTEQKDRGRLQSTGSTRKQQHWENCFITSGEEPITQDNSGAGAINRVLELECKAPLFKDPNKVVTDIADCYGVLGPAFIEWARAGMDTSKISFQQYERDLLAMNATGKQVQAAALLLTAYELFQAKAGGPMLKLEDIRPCIRTVQEVDVSERAYQYVVDQILTNRLKFVANGYAPKAGEVWGGLVPGRAYVINTVMRTLLNSRGYSLPAVRDSWVNKGYLNKNKEGRTFWRHTVNGYGGNMCELSLPSETGDLVNV